MRRQLLLKLFRIAIGTARPLKCDGRECPRHGVINVTGEAAIGAEREHHLRPNLANAQHQIAYCLVEISPVELTVGIVKHLTAGDVEHLAGGRKFGAPQAGELVIGAGAAAISRRSSRRHAHNEGIDAVLVREQQRAAKCPGFIVGVGSYAEQLRHRIGWMKLAKRPTRESVTKIADGIWACLVKDSAWQPAIS